MPVAPAPGSQEFKGFPGYTGKPCIRKQVSWVPAAHAYNPTYLGKISGRSQFKASPRKKQDPISKIANTKRVGRVAQAAEHLPSKCEALVFIRYPTITFLKRCTERSSF
jgi:hypothetical protein